MYFLIFLFLLIFGAIQEWTLTTYVYAWLARDNGTGIALIEVLLSFFLAAVLGVKLFRQVGLKLLQTAQQQLARGVAPSRTLAEGLLLVVAAVLLIVPGYISDAIGVLVLILRKPLAGLVLKQLGKGLASGRVVYQTHTSQPQDGTVVIDVEAIDGNGKSPAANRALKDHNVIDIN